MVAPTLGLHQLGSSGEATEPTTLKVTPVGWFITVVTFSGLIEVAQVATGFRNVPVQLAARAALFALAVLALARNAGRARSAHLPQYLVRSIAVFVSTPLITVLVAQTRIEDGQEALASYLFMYGIGVCTAIFLLTPVSVSFGMLFKVLTAATLVFAVAQVSEQRLILSDDQVRAFGIAYSTFVNGQLRATSFFVSAPRLAEFCTFLLLLAQYRIMVPSPRPRRWAWVLLYLVCGFVLYNTYSRAGLVLYFVGSVSLAALCAHRMNRGAGPKRLGAVAIASLLASPAVIALTIGFPGSGGIGDTTSLAARQAHWRELLAGGWGESVSTLLVGSGRSARFNAFDPDRIVVDNLFLAVMLFGGLLGLAALILLYASALRAGLQTRRLAPSLFEPVLAFYLALLAEGIFVDNHNTIFLATFLLLSLVSMYRLRAAQ